MTCAATFKHEPLDLDPDKLCIRLLRLLPTSSDGAIQCHIVNNVSLSAGQTPWYIAISYEWGQVTDTHHTIHVDGCSLRVRQNLFDFITDFNNTWPDIEYTALWIDALCIDQNNIRERNHQVSQMKQIYQSANCVVAWLGTAADDSEFLFSLINSVEVKPPYPDEEGLTDEIDLDFTLERPADESVALWNRLNVNEAERMRFLNSMHKLAQRTYWSRTWVIQEMILPSRLLFKCGSKTTSWVKLYWTNAMPSRTGKHFDSSCCYPEGSAMPEDSAAMIALEARCRYLESDQTSLGSLSSTVRDFSAAQSTEARDKVYALLAVTDSDGHFEVNYAAPVVTVFYQLIRLVQSWKPEPSYSIRKEEEKSIVLGPELLSVLRALDVTLYDVIQPLLPSVIPGPDQLRWYSGGTASGTLRKTNPNCRSESGLQIGIARDMEIQVTVSSAFLTGTDKHKFLMKHHWGGIMALVRRKRVKLCNCDLCSVGWRKQPLELKASSTHLRRFNENIIMRTDTGCMFIYACSNFHASPDEPRRWVYAATGILLNQSPTALNPIEEWDLDDLTSAKFNNAYLLLYYDQTMVPREAPDGSEIRIGWSTTQLANLAAHQSLGRVSVGTAGGRKCALGPCCADLSTLQDVLCSFHLYPARYNRPLKLATVRLMAAAMLEVGRVIVNADGSLSKPNQTTTEAPNVDENRSIAIFLGGSPQISDVPQVLDVMYMAQDIKARDWQSSDPCILDNNYIYTLGPNKHWDHGDGRRVHPSEGHWSDAYRTQSSRVPRNYQLI